MADDLANVQKTWIESYDAYREKIDVIRTDLANPLYADPTSKSNQLLRVKLLETEFALQLHLNAGMDSVYLHDVAQPRFQVIAPRTESVGGLLYNNSGQPPIFDVSIPESARAAWFVEMRDSYNSVVSRATTFYNQNLAPYIIEAVRGVGSFAIDRLFGRILPQPGNLLGVPVHVNHATDELGTGLTDEIINNQLKLKTPGKIITDEILGPPPGEHPHRAVDDFLGGVFLEQMEQMGSGLHNCIKMFSQSVGSIVGTVRKLLQVGNQMA